MTDAASLLPAYFDALYARDADPWRFATSAYERQKYAATLDALPAVRFASAFEVGCSIGVLTRLLAPRCDALLAVDVAEAALSQARARCADCAHAVVRRMRVPAEWPAQRFDLILFSEVLYYLSRADIAWAARCARHSIMPGGAMLLVHYIQPTDYPCSGDEASACFIRDSGAAIIMQRRSDAYRLDLLRA
jgi:SAM-dependent methyltransferase